MANYTNYINLNQILINYLVRASPLSKESPEQNYRGFYNLAILLLFVNNVRLIIENYVSSSAKLFSTV